MKTAVVVDSHSSITPEEAGRLGIFLLPAPFLIDGVNYYENENITREKFFELLTSGASVSTYQPTPDSIMEIWDKVLLSFDELLYMPISSGLSGSCSTSMLLAEQDKYKGRVYVVDNGRISTPMHCTVLDALEMIEAGHNAAHVKSVLEKYRDEEVIYFAVDTLEYLKKGGRITPAAAAVGSILKIKPILQLTTGILAPYRNARGMVKAKAMMIEQIRTDLNTRFSDWYKNNAFYLMTATSADPHTTADWIRQVKEAFPGIPVLSDYLSLGVCCHTGPGALGIGVSVKPV